MKDLKGKSSVTSTDTQTHIQVMSDNKSKRICISILSDPIKSFIISRYDENKNRSSRHNKISPVFELTTPKIPPTIHFLHITIKLRSISLLLLLIKDTLLK